MRLQTITMQSCKECSTHAFCGIVQGRQAPGWLTNCVAAPCSTLLLNEHHTLPQCADALHTCTDGYSRSSLNNTQPGCDSSKTCTNQLFCTRECMDQPAYFLPCSWLPPALVKSTAPAAFVSRNCWTRGLAVCGAKQKGFLVSSKVLGGVQFDG